MKLIPIDLLDSNTFYTYTARGLERFGPRVCRPVCHTGDHTSGHFEHAGKLNSIFSLFQVFEMSSLTARW